MCGDEKFKVHGSLSKPYKGHKGIKMGISASDSLQRAIK